MDILVCGLVFWRPEFEICFIYKVAWLNFENWLFFSPRANKGRLRSTKCFNDYLLWLLYRLCTCMKMRGILNGIVHWTWILITNVLVSKTVLFIEKELNRSPCLFWGSPPLNKFFKKVNQKWPRQLNRPNRFCNYVNRFLTSLLWINSTYFPWNLCNVNKCSNHFGTLTPFVEITVTFGIRLPSFDVHYVYLSSFQFFNPSQFSPQYTSGLPEAFSKPQ